MEGFHLVEEAYHSNWTIKEIILTEETDAPHGMEHLPIEKVSESVFGHISQTKTPQGIAAMVAIHHEPETLGDSMLLIDSVQDPGNLGTLIRTADAAGFDGVVLGDGTVDLYNDKVVRATQGSLFHMPIFQTNLQEIVPRLKQEGFNVWATALLNAKKYNEVAVEDKVAVIVGNEGAGVQRELLDMADTIVNIPIYGKAESLNVSIAAGILMYYIKT
ncbi:RNA methyltransferase [Virgibacillus ainsalahensis]